MLLNSDNQGQNNKFNIVSANWIAQKKWGISTSVESQAEKNKSSDSQDSDKQEIIDDSEVKQSPKKI